MLSEIFIQTGYFLAAVKENITYSISTTESKMSFFQTDDDESFASACQRDVDLMLIGDEAEMLTLQAQTWHVIHRRRLHGAHCSQDDVVPLTACTQPVNTHRLYLLVFARDTIV